MIDLKNYQEKKTKGLVSLVKAGDAYAVATKKFDADTGENLSDEVVGVNLQELKDRKTELEKEIKEIDAFIAECESLI